MNFVNPGVLFGLIAATIPILLHLLNLRRIKKIEFSSLQFLKELKKSQIRRIKLRQILLLILRTLLIILLVGAFSRPIIKGSLPFFKNYSKTSAVIFIDNSPSMDFSDEYGNRFNYAKRLAKKILEQLQTGDEVAIVEMSQTNNSLNLEFSSNLKKLTEQVNKINIGYQVANLSEKIKILPYIFDNAKNINREVFIISDNQSINFKNFDTSKINMQSSAFYFFNIGQNSKIDIRNNSIDSIKYVTRIFQTDTPLILQAQIHNHSTASKSSSFVSMNLGEEKVAQNKFTLNKKGISDVTISSNLKQDKVIKGSLELESDILEEDNYRYFGIMVPAEPKVAYITDNPNPFINSALGIGLSKAFCNAQLFSTIDFNSLDLNQFDVLLIDTYENISTEKLDNYLKNAGRVMFIASDNSESINNVFSKLKLGKVIFQKNDADQKGIISNIMKQHPLFQGVFLDETQNMSPDNVKIYQIEYCENGLPLIETTSGNLLSEIQIENGLVFYLSVAPTSNWTNLQTTSLFPIILYRSILYLTMLPELSSNIEVGEPGTLFIPSRFADGSNFTIIDEQGLETSIFAPTLPSGTILNIPPIFVPGNYLIKNSQNKEVAIISVNINKDESDFSTMDNDKIPPLLKQKLGEDTFVAFVEDFDEVKEKINKVRTGTELWYFLIILAILIALTEMVVQRVMKHDVVE
ncbi:MAG: hypothetical protein A2X64_03715 [Ignavibacteria bacterium GWF2_33_9]|nr:MAG: hypothetical protein A2X64_03715 [Ignavibacteria bacterium GWF2_33_9]